MRSLLLLSLFMSVGWANDLQATFDRGQEIYLTAGGYGCAICHGPVGDGAGQAGGYIRGATIEQLMQSLKDVAPMQPLSDVLSADDLNAVSNYLSGLANIPLINLTRNETGWIGGFESWQPNQVVDVVLYNATFEPVSVDLTPMHLGKVELAPLQRKALKGKVQVLEKDTAHLDISWSPLLTVTEPGI